MAIRAKEGYLGAWAFLIGIILAIAVGLFSNLFTGDELLNPYLFGIILILGIVVGFFTEIGDRDSHSFLLASIAIVIASWAGITGIQSLVSFAGLSGISEVEIVGIQMVAFISSTLGAMLMLLVPATIIVAIKTLFSIAHR